MYKIIRVNLLLGLLFMRIFFMTAHGAELTLTTPLKLQVVVQTGIYQQPNTNSEMLKQLEYRELIDAQTLKSFGQSLWWQLQLDSGGIGYIPAEHLSKITADPKNNETGLYTPYLMGMTHTVKLILQYDKERNLEKFLYDYLQVPLLSEFPTAYWLVGVLYRDGLDISQDSEEAMKYFFKAIHQGEYRAYFDLAQLFSQGSDTIKPDQDEAIRFARLGAEKDDPRAKDWLASLDISMIQDRTHPIQSRLDSLNERVQNNDTEAMRLLAAYHLSAQSVSYDDIKAEELLLQAAKLGNIEAMVDLAGLYLTGAKNILPQTQASNYWILKAAMTGHKKAQYLYGNAVYHGLGVPANKQEGLRWLQKSADQGYPQALINLQEIQNQTEHTALPTE